jgi:hypothetical protein
MAQFTSPPHPFSLILLQRGAENLPKNPIATSNQQREKYGKGWLSAMKFSILAYYLRLKLFTYF